MGLLPACFPGKHRSELKSTMSSSPKRISQQPQGMETGGGQAETGDRQWMGNTEGARADLSLAMEVMRLKGQQKHFLIPALEGKLGKGGDDEGVTFPETIPSVLLRTGGWQEAEGKKEAGVMGQ